MAAGSCLPTISRTSVLGIGALAASLMPAAEARAADCLSISPQGPMQVTAACTDPIYNAAVFKIVAVSPVSGSRPYTKVSAQFVGTPYHITIYLPPATAWQGRFFQHVYPLQDVEAAPGDIAFAMSSGGYLVNTNGTMRGNAGYRVDAAAAKLARDYAARFYGWTKPIHGYIWGGSGGSFQTLGAIENTTGVWDGAVPYVIADEGSFLNYQSHSALIELALNDKLPALADAVSPGGSGNPRALLYAEQRKVFDEALAMGFPLRGFEFISYRINDILSQPGAPAGAPPLVAMPYLLADSVRTNDPTYVDDFWTKPGYEGANPPAYLKAALVDHVSTITAIIRNAAGVPTSIQLDSVPMLGTTGATGLENWLYAADGKTKVAGLIKGKRDGSSTTIQLAEDNDRAVLTALTVGSKLRINNRLMLAMIFYHRHSIPLSRDFTNYAQYRDARGRPLYPQRAFSAARWSMLSTGGGGTQTGKITGKVIVVGNLLDINAYPANADRYARRVRQALGERAFADNFRLWYNDNANHIDRAPSGPNAPRLVTYVPILYQALRDLSAWVERGITPSASTQYAISDAQINVPDQALLRRGIQPVVHLTVDGAKSIQVALDLPVAFRSEIKIPPGVGKVIATEWYFGDSPVSFKSADFTPTEDGAIAIESHTFRKPGTYFVTVRAKVQRDVAAGDSAAPENIDRIRVIVGPRPADRARK